jgi:hypothetical protein
MTYPTFVNGDPLPQSDLNAIGLWLVKSQAVGSGVASVTITDAFSSQFDNYRVIFANGISGANDNAISISFAPVASHFGSMRYDSFTGSGSGTLFTNAQTFIYLGLSGTAGQQSLVFDVFAPFLTQFTKVTAMLTSNLYTGYSGGVYAQNTSNSGFTLIAPAGGFTGGTVKVYGYRN